MSVRSKALFALLATAIAVPATSFAYWIPSNSEQGGTEVQDGSNMKSRAQVIQELEQAKADPTWATREGEETGSWPVALTRSARHPAALFSFSRHRYSSLKTKLDARKPA